MDVSQLLFLNKLTCYNNQIPIILTKEYSNITINKDVITQIAVLKSRDQNPSIPGSITGGYVLGTSGAIINLTDNYGSLAEINTITGSNPSVIGILPSGVLNILNDKYWTIANPDLSGKYNLILDLSTLSGILNFQGLKVLKREDASVAWQNVSTFPGVTVQYLEPFILINGLSSFSDFAVANEIDVTPPASPINLTAMATGSDIVLNWDKNTENDFLRYRIYRASSSPALILVDSTSGGISDTSITISGLANGNKYYFRVTALDNSNNNSSYSNEVSITIFPVGIDEFGLNSGLNEENSMLSQNFPNPFGLMTSISYQLAVSTDVQLEILNINGQKLRVLVSSFQSPGKYLEIWDGKNSTGQNMPSGIYFCRIRTSDYSKQIKMILLRTY